MQSKLKPCCVPHKLVWQISNLQLGQRKNENILTPLKPTSCCIVVVSQLKYWLFKILEILGNIRNILEELSFWLCDIKANELELPSLFDAVKLQGILDCLNWAMKLEAISQVANSNEVICLCQKNGQLMTHKIILSYLCSTFASPNRENLVILF